MKNYLSTLFALSLVLAGCNGSKQAKTVTLGSNSFITHMYTVDPSAHVREGGRLYVYVSHDVDPPRECDLTGRYHVFSIDDMVNRTDHGEVLNPSQVSWGRKEGGFMWASDCTYKDGTYHYYFPHPSGTDWNHTWRVGVVTSKHPAKDFTVHERFIEMIGMENDCSAMINPYVFVDDDKQTYFHYGGGGRCVGAKMKSNMMELAESSWSMEGLKDLHEAAWVHKRNGIYYLSYVDNHAEGGKGANRLNYTTSNSPLGSWTYQGIYLEPTGCDTSYGSIVEYKGEWYVFYHNSPTSGEGNLRSICADKLHYNPGDTIQVVEQTKQLAGYLLYYK